MNKKLERVRDDIRKTEQKMRETEEYLKTLRMQEKQLEDEEIIKQIRSMNRKNGDVLDVLTMIQELKAGAISAPAQQDEEREDIGYEE